MTTVLAPKSYLAPNRGAYDHCAHANYDQNPTEDITKHRIPQNLGMRAGSFERTRAVTQFLLKTRLTSSSLDPKTSMSSTFPSPFSKALRM